MYGYVPWPLPVRWNRSFTYISFVRPFWKHLPFLFVLSLSILYAFCNLHMLVFYTWIKTTTGLIFIQKLFLFLVFAAILTAVVVLKTLANQALLKTCNEFILLTTYLSRGNAIIIIFDNWILWTCNYSLNFHITEFSHRAETGNMSVKIHIATFNCYIFLHGLAITPFAFGFTSVFTGYDCAKYMLDEYILPEPEKRSTTCVLFSLAVGFGLNYLVGLELHRSVSFISLCILFAIKTLLTFVRLIPMLPIFSRFRLEYIKIRILLSKAEARLTKVIYIVLASGFWLQVVFSWIVCRSSYDELALLYVMFSLAVAVFLISHLVFLPRICGVLEYLVVVLSVYRRRQNMLFVTKPSAHSRFLDKQARGMYPIRIKYGQFWYINQGFIGEYLEALSLRTFDVVLISGS